MVSVEEQFQKEKDRLLSDLMQAQQQHMYDKGQVEIYQQLRNRD